MGDTKSLDTVKKMTGLDVTQMFKDQLASFDVKTGKETLKFEGKVNDSEVKAKIAEMDKKADAAIDKANRNANAKVAKNYTEALDKAYKQFVASGANMTQPDSQQVDSNSSNSQTTPVSGNSGASEEADKVKSSSQDNSTTPVGENNEQKPIIHKIRTGQNLTKIAKHYGVSIDDIIKANEIGKGKAIVNQNLIIAGKEIKIPNKKEQVS